MSVKLLKDREVAEMLSVAVSTVWEYAKTGVIPKPMKIGCSTRWVRSEIETVLTDQIGAREQQNPPSDKQSSDAEKLPSAKKVIEIVN